MSFTRGGRPLEDHHPTKVILDLPRILSRLVTCQLVIQILLLMSTTILSPHTQMPPQNYQNSSPFYLNSPPLYRITSLIYQSVAPNCANVQSNYRAPTSVYQVQALVYQNAPTNYQAPSPNYQTNPYPRSQAPCPNTRSYQQVPPSQQGS